MGWAAEKCPDMLLGYVDVLERYLWLFLAHPYMGGYPLQGELQSPAWRDAICTC
jgi:hypothetical protein